MAELNPPEGPYVLTGPATDVEANKLRTSAAAFRRMLAASLDNLPGIAQVGDLKVTATGTDVNVTIAAGDVFALGTQSTAQGMYHGKNDAAKVIALLTANPAHATLDRIDLVIARFNDAFYAGGLDTFSIEMVTGTPSGSPAVPALPANSIALAQISVVHATTVVNPALITDKRLLTRGRSYHAEVNQGVAQAIANNASNLLNFETIESDQAASFTVGVGSKYTVPVTGRYLVTAMAMYAGAPAVSNNNEMLLMRNGTEMKRLFNSTWAAAAANPQVGGSVVVRLTAADYLQLSLFQNTGGSINTFGSGLYTWAQFTYLGPN